MKSLPLISLLALSVAAAAGFYAANAKADTQAAETQLTTSSDLIVAELFTSQSCSSCPPAEALFSTLAEREDLLTLEWHVDYWDTLVHGGSKWKDRYSSKEFTNRQRSYNQSLRGTRAVYTPQAIINGKLEEAGNRRHAVSNMLENAPSLSTPVQIVNKTVTVGANSDEVEVLFVRLLKQHETDVKGGENKGRLLAGKNIVLEAEVLGTTKASNTSFKLPSVGSGETCAVLVQSLSHNVGPVLGAAKCS